MTTDAEDGETNSTIEQVNGGARLVDRPPGSVRSFDDEPPCVYCDGTMLVELTAD